MIYQDKILTPIISQEDEEPTTEEETPETPEIEEATNQALGEDEKPTDDDEETPEE